MDPAEQNRLTKEVGRAMVRVAGAHWQKIRVEYRSAGRHVEIDLTITGHDGQLHVVRPPAEVVAGLGRMRGGMYRPGRGTWMSAVYEIEPPGTFSVDFEPDVEPTWRRVPPPIGFLDELRFFPRSDEHIPDWMRARAGMPPAVSPETQAAHTPPGGVPVPGAGQAAPGGPDGQPQAGAAPIPHPGHPGAFAQPAGFPPPVGPGQHGSPAQPGQALPNGPAQPGHAVPTSPAQSGGFAQPGSGFSGPAQPGGPSGRPAGPNHHGGPAQPTGFTPPGNHFTEPGAGAHPHGVGPYTQPGGRHAQPEGPAPQAGGHPGPSTNQNPDSPALSGQPSRNPWTGPTPQGPVTPFAPGPAPHHQPATDHDDRQPGPPRH